MKPISAIFCRKFSQRLKGLLGFDKKTARILFFPSCRSIHTIGVKYPLDVFFLSSDSTVIAIKKSMKSHKLCSNKKADSVLEIPSHMNKWNICVGDTLIIHEQASNE
jgi:uncharacterized membrane protein (UPF0127 family)